MKRKCLNCSIVFNTDDSGTWIKCAECELERDINQIKDFIEMYDNMISEFDGDERLLIAERLDALTLELQGLQNG
jgi:hypothetical protein